MELADDDEDPNCAILINEIPVKQLLLIIAGNTVLLVPAVGGVEFVALGGPACLKQEVEVRQKSIYVATLWQSY